MNYEPDHYLYGKTDEQITTLAQSAIDMYDNPSTRDTDVYERCAVIHELKRLKAKFDGSSAIDVSLLNEKASSRIAWLEAEVAKLREENVEYFKASKAVGDEIPTPESWRGDFDLATRARKLRKERDTLKAADELNRKGIEHRDIRIAELKSTHPPEDWLTRAIATAGAPEGSNWDGLLEWIDVLVVDARKGRDCVGNVRNLRKEREKLTRDKESWEGRATRSNFMLRQVHGELPDFDSEDGWDDAGLDGEVRKLRERAESAEAQITGLHAACEEYNERCNMYKGRAESGDVRIKELESTVARMKREQACAESRLSELEDTPTQTDLSRIAAALEKIANAH